MRLEGLTKDMRERIRACMGWSTIKNYWLLRDPVSANEKVLRVLLEWPHLHPSWVPVLMRVFADGKLEVDPDGDVWIERELIMSSELADKARRW